MRIPGRFWWAYALGACACGAGSVILLYMGLTGSVARDAPMGISIGPDIAMTVFSSVMCLALSGILVWQAAQVLARYRRRRRAIVGNPQAMSLARVNSPLAIVPGLTSGPLVLQWRVQKPIVVFESLFLCLKALVPLGFCGAVLYFNWQSLQQPTPHLPTFGQALTMVVCLLLGGGMCVAGWFWLRIRWFQWRNVFGIIATQDGLASVDEGGRRAFIRWRDVRLFEVEAHAASMATTHVWRLYGSQDFVEWSYYPPGSELRPESITYAEAVSRAYALIGIVEEQTGMQQRTLSKALIVQTDAVAVSAPQTI